MLRVIFVADDGFSGREPWITDTTADGTRLLADIWPGGGPSSPTVPVPFGEGLALFNATDPAHGFEPRVTDGTEEGTRLLRDVNTAQSGYASSNPGNFTDLGGGLALFTAAEAERDAGLWITDGTEEGTRRIEVPPDLEGYNSTIGPIVALGDGQALFAALTDLGTELWTTDGTDDGTRLVRDINPGPAGSYPGYYGQRGMLALGDGRALFSAEDGATGRELWISDGTEEGTRLVRDLWPGGYAPYPGGPEFPFGSYPTNFALLEPGRAVFGATTPEDGNELWVSDGTAEGTLRLTDVQAGPGVFPITGASPSSPLSLGDGRVLFGGDDGETGREPWITDGTPEGTFRLADIWEGGGSSAPGSGSSSYPPYQPYQPYQPYPPYPPYPPYQPYPPGGQVALGDGRALFSATDPMHGTELWVTDGTTEGTRLVRDINGDRQGFASSTPSQFAALGDGRAIFSADDGENGPQPWITDGTADGTMLLRVIAPEDMPSWPMGYAVLGRAEEPVPEEDGAASDDAMPDGPGTDDIWPA